MAAKFPTALATDADLLVAMNRAQTTLVGTLNSSATTFTLASDAFAVNVAVTMGSEIILILTKTGATVDTCTRGFDGTTAASHVSGVLVSAYIDSVHHRQMSAEVQAIETALGASMANVAIPNPLTVAKGGTGVQTLTGLAVGSGTSAFSGLAPSAVFQFLRSGAASQAVFGTLPVYFAQDYNFTPQTPSGTLAIGSNTVTVTIPPGITADSIAIGHNLYVYGTGTPEVVPITGFSSTTVTFTCAGTHSAGWSISSATLGMQEAIIAIQGSSAGAGRVLASPGAQTLLGKVTVPTAAGVSLRGMGMGSTYLNLSSATVGSPGLTGNWFVYQTGSGVVKAAVDFGDMSIANLSSTYHSAGAFLSVTNRIKGTISNLEMIHAYDCIALDTSSSTIGVSNVKIIGRRYGISYAGASGFEAAISGSVISGGSAAICCTGVCTGFYATGTLFDNTASGYATISSSAIRFTQDQAVGALNEIVISGCDLESAGDGLEFTSTGVAYLNNSVNVTGCRINAQTYGVYAAGWANGLHVVGNNITVSSANGVAGVYGSDVRDLSVQANRFSLQNAVLYAVQFAGTTSRNAIITGNSISITSTATLTNGVLLASGLVNVLIEGNDWNGVTTPVNSIAGTNVQVRGYTGTVASASALTLPAPDNFTITGTTPVTSVAVNQGVARFGMITAPSGVTFTLAASIGNTYAIPAGVPVPYYWDGTLFWIGSAPNRNPAQFVTNTTTTTFASGQLTGAPNVVYANTGNTPGTITTRTAALMFSDTPNAYTGQTYRLRIYHGGTGTLTIAAGTNVTLTGTMTIATTTWRDFIVTFTDSTHLVIQNVGSGTA